MKWILACLLVLNAGYFSLQWFAADEVEVPKQATVAVESGVNGSALVLLSEVQREELEVLMATMLAWMDERSALAPEQQ